MKISRISLENVKCFKSQELSLVKKDTDEPLSVCALVGANGSGKSAVLKAIVATFTTVNAMYAGEVFDDEAIYGDETQLFVKLALQLNEHEKEVLQVQDEEYELIYSHNSELEEHKDMLRYPGSILDKEGEILDNCRAYADVLTRLSSNDEMGLVMYYDPFRFVSQRNPAGPNITELDNPKKHALASNIRVDGRNLYRDLELKQWLVNIDYMRLKEPTARNQKIYDHIVKAFELLLRPLRYESINQNGCLVFLDEKEGQRITIDMLSDGFKSIFSIVVDIIRRLMAAPDLERQEFYEKEAVILIDEIDCHIHPKWQKKLMPAFRELFPNCQFIITTHSPYILDTLQEYEVIKLGEKSIV